jgi:hypothetical protein
VIVGAGAAGKYPFCNAPNSPPGPPPPKKTEIEINQLLICIDELFTLYATAPMQTIFSLNIYF